MSHQIEHSGVVQHVGDGHVQVLIVQTSACAACKVASYCNAAESKEMMVTVLVVVLLLTDNEAAAALGGLLALAPYYGVLYLLRRRLRDQLSFAIK